MKSSLPKILLNLERLFLNPIGALALVALFVYGLSYWDRDPMGDDYEKRVEAEILKCVDAPQECVGGRITLRDGTNAEITNSVVGRLEFQFSYERSDLVRQVASIEMKL